MIVDLQGKVRLAAEYLRQQGASEVYLFGSAARGDMHPRSDVDFAVRGIRPEMFYRVTALAEDLLGLPLDVVDLDEDTPFGRYLLASKVLQRVA